MASCRHYDSSKYKKTLDEDLIYGVPVEPVERGSNADPATRLDPARPNYDKDNQMWYLVPTDGEKAQQFRFCVLGGGDGWEVWCITHGDDGPILQYHCSRTDLFRSD